MPPDYAYATPIARPLFRDATPAARREALRCCRAIKMLFDAAKRMRATGLRSSILRDDAARRAGWRARRYARCDAGSAARYARRGALCALRRVSTARRGACAMRVMERKDASSARTRPR